jgi:hypothetical protein
MRPTEGNDNEELSILRWRRTFITLSGLKRQLAARWQTHFIGHLTSRSQGGRTVTLEGLHAAIASARWFTRLGTFTPRAGYAASRDLTAWAESSIRELFIFSEPHPIT